MPERGVDLIPRGEILSYEEILRFVHVAVQSGINKIRITGGEPLMRMGIVGFMERLAKIKVLEDISLTTNGILLAEMAGELKKAGLRRINISLDSLNPEKYHWITRSPQQVGGRRSAGDLDQVRKGILKALDVGFAPVKINMVGIRGFNDDELTDMAAMTLELPIHVRFIEFMPMGERFFWTPQRHLPISEIRDIIQKHYCLLPLEEKIGSGPAETYKIEGAKGVIGFISPISSRFCAQCNRLRLTADGHLRTCLFSDREVDIKTSLRCGASDTEIQDKIYKISQQKPLSQDIGNIYSTSRFMPSIGG
jgi:cyclic pyranopterin phosphate synthase